MTQTQFSAVITEKALADLAGFWEDPKPSRFGERIPTRIAGSPQDQITPEGVSNPYWEIVRQIPVDGISHHYDGAYQPDSYFFTPAEPMRTLIDRHALCGTFAWSIPSPGDIAWITQRLGGRGVVEPGAGGGYWAWQLAQAGVDVVAYEPNAPEANRFVSGEPWFPVLMADHDAVKRHPDRSLLLCWPDYSEPWASWALSCYEGSQLFYIGEGWGGCCADDDFFKLLEAGWDEVGSSPHHVTFSGIHCHLTEYQRRG